jgi:transposase
VPVVGLVERNGRVKAIATPNHGEEAIVPFVERNLKKLSILYTDGAPVYNIPQGYFRGVVYHAKKEYVRGAIHTNTIEGFWSQVKRTIRSTYVSVSKTYLQSYVDEAVFRYNHRKKNAFDALLARL